LQTYISINGILMVAEIEKDLKNWFIDAKKIVVAGIGNPIRSDDYVGLRIVEGLKGKVSDSVCLLECETVPENYLIEIEEFRPTHVLLVDAAFLELKSGEASLVEAERMMDYSAISTHALPLKIFCEHLKKTSDAKIGLLLIEPKNIDFGEGLSVEVEAAAQRLIKLLLELFVKRPLFFSKRSRQ
jgi:hydrogenase 3 maturation protease